MTDDMRARYALFLVGCMGTRFGAAELVRRSPTKYFAVYGMMALVLAFAFAAIYVGKLRTTGPETFGQPIWWDHMRPLHALMFGVFAYMSFTENRDNWKVLAADATLGLVAFTSFHSCRQANQCK